MEPMRGLFLGDCLDILPRIQDASVNLVLTDLPYGMTSNKWDSVIPFDHLWGQLLRVGVQNAVFAFTSCQPFTTSLILSQPTFWRHEWVWIKNRGSNFVNTTREPFKEHETVQVFSRGKWTYNPQKQPRIREGKEKPDFKGTTYRKNHFSTSANYRTSDQPMKTRGEYVLTPLRLPSSWQRFNVCVSRLHPTAKPVALMEYLIRTYTNEGDVVLDCCMGSGTTCLAAKNTMRKFIGIEKDRRHYATAYRRVFGREPRMPR